MTTTRCTGSFGPNKGQTAKALLSGAAMLALLAGTAAQAQDETLETVTVTGYRASLESSTFAKKASVGFTDAVFAEDIGKFPDTNLAESLNRIPGITMGRDIDGSGVNIQIRGLGTNFTKIMLNNAQIAVATTGATDSGNANREVDLNMFPGELFTQLQVDKTPRAELLEGGAAGTVNMRTRRPFDNPGMHITYIAQGMNNSLSNGMGGNGALVASNTWEDTKIGSFGVLVGIAGRRGYNYVKGWEDGNAGWVTPTMNNATLCGSATGCDNSGSTTSIGGNSMTIPATVPVGVTIPGYAVGSTVNAAMLQALNPNVTMTQLSNALLPRLGRPMYQRGTRDRYNGVVSFEWRPNERLHFYLDMIAGRQFNSLDRADLGWGVRGGNGAQSMIPSNVTVDANNVTLSGKFYNAQFFLEARPYQEKGDFYNINPGMSYQVTDLLEVDFQMNASRSHFLRDSPSFFVVSCPSTPSAIGCAAPTGGVVATFDNTGSGAPSITSNIDLNNPANFQWSNGRVNLQDEKRYTQTTGAHLDVKYGGEEISVKVGAAYDQAFRGIAGVEGSKDWSQVICGGNVSNTVCDGQAGSAIPQSQLANYIKGGPAGFIMADYDKIKSASSYYAIDYAGLNSTFDRCKGETGAYYATGTNTGTTAGCYDEKTYGMYAQVDGVLQIGERSLNYDIGLRWAETHETIYSPSLIGSKNYTFNGVTRSYNAYSFLASQSVYQAFLPSISLAYHVADDFVVRASASRTMSRPDVSQMIAVMNFSGPDASSGSVGNPNLKPYFSNNIDLGVEYYTGDEGYISATMFRKYISGFTTTTYTTQPFSFLAPYGYTWDNLTSTQQQNLTGRWGCNSDASCATAATVTISQQHNAAGIESINGIEMGYVQPLDFLTDKYIGFKGLGVTANVTIVDQSSSGSVATHATGVAPYTYNLTGYYEHNGLMARMSYTYSARVYASGSNSQSVCLPNTTASTAGCPGGAYLFGAAYGQADFSSSLKLAKIFGELPSDPEITFDVQNVFNSKQWSYFQYTNAVHSYYQKGQTFMFGLHGSF